MPAAAVGRDKSFEYNLCHDLVVWLFNSGDLIISSKFKVQFIDHKGNVILNCKRWQCEPEMPPAAEEVVTEVIHAPEWARQDSLGSNVGREIHAVQSTTTSKNHHCL